MFKELFSRTKKRQDYVSSSGVDFSGYIFFREFYPGVFRKLPISATRNIGNFEEAERRKILNAGGVIEPPRMAMNTEKWVFDQVWHRFNEELKNKNITLPKKERVYV